MGKRTRSIVSSVIPSATRDLIDQAAQRSGTTRSRWLKQAAEAELARQQRRLPTEHRERAQ